MWKVCQDRAYEGLYGAPSAGVSSQSRQLAARRACLDAAKPSLRWSTPSKPGMGSTCCSQTVAIAGSDELQSIQEILYTEVVYTLF